MLGQIKIDKDLVKKLDRVKLLKDKAVWKKVVTEEYIAPTNLPTCVIFDIDGTLAIRGDRGPFDFSKCEEDTINHQVRYFANLVKRDKQISVIAITGREDVWRPQTEKWLKSNEVEYDQLFMRTAGDHRYDFIIKKEIFDAKIRDKYQVFFAVDDRKQVQKLWVSLGIFIFSVNQHDELF